MDTVILDELTLRDVQPSQFYILEDKLRDVSFWFDKNNLAAFPPIPIKLSDRVPVMTDGHTRAVWAIQQGLEKLPFIWDEDELNWEMYRRCV